MNILVVMIPLSITLLIGAVIAFFWAVDHGQFDDLETPRLLPLLDRPDAPGVPAATLAATTAIATSGAIASTAAAPVATAASDAPP